MESGVYCILNLVNSKKYIGSSKDVSARINSHKKSLLNNKHPNSYLQASWNKYGSYSFWFSKIETCSLDTLIEKEQYWMDYFKSYSIETGYNQRPKAGSPRGYKHTEEAKKKIGEAHIGFKFSEDSKRKISLAQKGRIFSKEQRKNMSIARKGIVLSEEHKMKIGETMKLIWMKRGEISISNTTRGTR